jgi:L-amino acid N-acyltransferase YncA
MPSDPTLRIARPDDAAPIAAIYAPYVRDTAVSFEVEPPGAAEMCRRIEATLDRHTWVVAEEDAGIVGYAYASAHRARAAYQWSVDVTVYLAPAAHRRGIGARLYRALFALLAHAGYTNAHAGIALPNAASVALHERLGFEPIGVYRGVGFKLGAWRDVGWWGKRLAPLATDPPAPRPVCDLPDEVVGRILSGA